MVLPVYELGIPSLNTIVQPDDSNMCNLMNYIAYISARGMLSLTCVSQNNTSFLTDKTIKKIIITHTPYSAITSLSDLRFAFTIYHRPKCCTKNWCTSSRWNLCWILSSDVSYSEFINLPVRSPIVRQIAVRLLTKTARAGPSAAINPPSIIDPLHPISLITGIDMIPDK